MESDPLNNSVQDTIPPSKQKRIKTSPLASVSISERYTIPPSKQKRIKTASAKAALPSPGAILYPPLNKKGLRRRGECPWMPPRRLTENLGATEHEKRKVIHPMHLCAESLYLGVE